jgi:hypothetical protein
MRLLQLYREEQAQNMEWTIPAALSKVCFGNGTFVAIGDKGAIYTSASYI